MELIIGGGVVILIWAGVGGFDWYFDMFECMKYEEVCQVCQSYLSDNVDYLTLEGWQFSMVNKYHEYLYPFKVWILNPDYYLDFVTMMQEYTKHDHTGMYSLMYSDRYSHLWISQFKLF